MNFFKILFLIPIFFNANNFIFASEIFDEKVLFKQKDWEVVLLRYDDRSTACVARNGKGNKELQIYVNSEVDELAIYYDDSDVNSTLKIFEFAVDDLSSWYSESPYLDSGWLIMDLNSGSKKTFNSLIREIREGQELFHLNEDRKIIDSFSLMGSAASLNKLEECIKEQGF